MAIDPFRAALMPRRPVLRPFAMTLMEGFALSYAAWCVAASIGHAASQSEFNGGVMSYAARGLAVIAASLTGSEEVGDPSMTSVPSTLFWAGLAFSVMIAARRMRTTLVRNARLDEIESRSQSDRDDTSKASIKGGTTA
jgi:hypothetical protein